MIVFNKDYIVLEVLHNIETVNLDQIKAHKLRHSKIYLRYGEPVMYSADFITNKRT